MFTRRHSPIQSQRAAATDVNQPVATVAEADFEKFASGSYSAIDFYATWCGPCRVLSPIYEAAARTHADRLRFGRCDVDANPEIAARLNILSVPTIVVFGPSGCELDRLVGAAAARQLDEFLYALVPGDA